MANGDDKPAFDPSQPFQAVDAKPPFDPTKPFTAGEAPQIGGARAAFEGLKQGATAGFADELTAGAAGFGLGEAAGYNPEFAEQVEQAGGLNKIVQQTRDEARATREAAQKQHPYLYGAGEIGGAGATMLLPGAAELRGATLGERAIQGAKIGAGYGAVSGAAEGQRDQGLLGGAAGAVTGGITGGVLGAAGTPVVEAAGALARPITSRVGAAWRALSDPEAEASRQLVQAGVGDIRTAGRDWQPLTPEQTAIARQAGTPLAAVDVMGPESRALGEWAASVSPAARAQFEQLGQRTKEAPSRVAQFVQDMTGGGDLNADRVALQQGAQGVNRPAYLKAYEAGDRPIWSPELERLTTSPDVEGALRGAVNRWKSFQVLDGYGGVNPPLQITPDGRMVSTGGKGMPTYPNLQLWDYARRTLSMAAENAKGEFGKPTTESTLLGGLAQKLNSALDNEVPEYAGARAGAAQFFGAQNALEAGAKFVSPQTNLKLGAARQALAKMSDDEQDLFARGYATELAERITRGGRSALNSTFGNPQAMERAEMALGPDRTRQLEALLRVEEIAKSAGNLYLGSPTARRLALQSALGVGFGGGEAGYDWLSGRGFDSYRTVTAGALPFLAGRGAKVLNERVAAQLGRMLTSNDPTIYSKGIQLASRVPAAMNRLRAVTGVGATTIAPKSLPAPAAAEDQQQVPGPGQQRKAGGRVKQSKLATKSEAHYRGGNAHWACAWCTMFVKPSSCTSVRGHISPRALCDFYEPEKGHERIVDNKHDVITGANSAKKPSGPIYIDRHIPEWSPHLRTKDGKRVRLWTYLSVHEDVEQRLMEEGETYDEAHEAATLAEQKKAEADGVNWAAYTKEIDRYLEPIEREKASMPPEQPLHVKPEAALKGEGHHHSSHKRRK